MKLKTILTLLLSCLIVFACQDDDDPTSGQKPDNDDDKNPVARDIDETAVAGIADEIIERWKLDDISEENYLQTIEDWDSVWHVYYPYRYSSEEEITLQAIPHLLIPKKEGETIRVFVTH